MPRIRITQQDLEYACARLNRVTENSEDGWTARPDGSMEARIGHFYIESAYGGWKLVQMANVFGGVREPLGSGYTSRRVLLGLIHAMIAGAMAVQAPVGKSCRETV